MLNSQPSQTGPVPPAPRRLRRLAVAACVMAASGAVAYLFIPAVRDLAHTAVRIAANRGVVEIEAVDEDLEITITQAGNDPVMLVIHKNTRQTLELPAADGEIMARDLPRRQRGRTTKLVLDRGGKKTFKAPALLAASPARLEWGVLSVANAGATAEFLRIQRLQDDGPAALGDDILLEPGETRAQTVAAGKYQLWTSTDGDDWKLASTVTVAPDSRPRHEITGELAAAMDGMPLMSMR